MGKVLPFPKAKKEIQPLVSQVRQAVCGELYQREPLSRDDVKEKVAAGTHRFDIHPGGAIYSQPQGFLVDRVEDRAQRMARNAVGIKVWNQRYVEVTDDGFVVRESG